MYIFLNYLLIPFLSSLMSGGKRLNDFMFICLSFLKFSLYYGKDSVTGRKSLIKVEIIVVAFGKFS